MDVSENRRETAVAAVISLLLHLLIILAVAFSLSLPAWQFVATPKAKTEEPPELIILPMEAPKKPAPVFVRTDPDPSAQAPKDARFESDNNTRAASEAPASGLSDLPSVEGRDSANIELASRDYADGQRAATQTPPAPPPVPEAKPTPEAKPLPAMDPASSQLALRDAPPVEKKQPVPKPVPPKQPPSAAGYQPETRVTRIRGNISNRGKASLEAAATPIGRYKKMVSDAIGSRWYYYVNSQIGLLNIGTVDIRFTVSPDGKVSGVKVISNTSNESFASVSISSIVEAEIPPIPEEVAKLLDSGRLEIDYSFTILSN